MHVCLHALLVAVLKIIYNNILCATFPPQVLDHVSDDAIILVQSCKELSFPWFPIDPPASLG